MPKLTDQTDEEILSLLQTGQIKQYTLDRELEPLRAVQIRQQFLLSDYPDHIRDTIPYKHYSNYETATKSCCENVIGYVPVPLGLAGPLLINGSEYNVPIATTEGALVASLSRGCRAVRESGGIDSTQTYFGMTRAPLIKFSCGRAAKQAADWILEPDNFEKLRAQFESTSRFAKLKSINPKQAGKLLFLRVVAATGDAMGMNMISKGCEKMLQFLKTVDVFENMTVLSISGNYCVDKKPSAMNWINNRGYSISCDVTLKCDVIKSVLKTSAGALAELNSSKNHVGSSLAGCIGGNNAHASNIVAGIYLATGQDIAQAGTSSMAMVNMECLDRGDLYVSVTMPCIEVGTVGGGTSLAAQQNNLQLLTSTPDVNINAALLAQVVCGAVLAGEISLLSALCSGDLVKSHMQLNRAER